MTSEIEQEERFLRHVRKAKRRALRHAMRVAEIQMTLQLAKSEQAALALQRRRRRRAPAKRPIEVDAVAELRKNVLPLLAMANALEGAADPEMVKLQRTLEEAGKPRRRKRGAAQGEAQPS